MRKRPETGSVGRIPSHTAEAIAAVIGIALVIVAPVGGRATDAVPTERGLVVWVGCGRIVLKATDGYVFLRSYGGSDLPKGNTLVGDLHTLGTTELHVEPGGARMEAKIEDTKLNLSRVQEMLNDKCGYPVGVETLSPK